MPSSLVLGVPTPRTAPIPPPLKMLASKSFIAVRPVARGQAARAGSRAAVVTTSARQLWCAHAHG